MTENTPAPIATAATWYVGAFAGLGSLLLAGTQFAGLDWERAREPWLAVLSMGVSVVAASAVVVLATRVLTPSETLLTLLDREDEASRQARRQTPKTWPEWEEVASKDWLLQRIVAHDLIASKPTELMSLIRSGDDAARTRGVELTDAANHWRARRSFTQLRWMTAIASIVVFSGAICWTIFSKPARSTPTTQSPVPVTVKLVATNDPAKIIGSGCSARELSGVAIEGDLRSRTLVAFPPQNDCPEKILLVVPDIGLVSARR